MPGAFRERGLEALFGAPALTWTPDDATRMGAHVFACGQSAAKDRRTDARNMLYQARRYLAGNLRGVLAPSARTRQAEQRKAARAAQREAAETARKTVRGHPGVRALHSHPLPCDACAVPACHPKA